MLNTYMYTHAQQNIASGEANAAILLPFSYSSLKHVISGLYKQNPDQNNLNVSSRSRCHVEEVFWTIGASRVPSKPLQSGREIMSETCKVYGVSTDLLQICNHIDRTNTEVQAGAVVGAESAVGERGTFAMGLDCEAFGATSSASRIENGINTTALQMYLNFKTGTGETFVQNSEVHSFGCYDVLISCQNGQAYARF